MFPSFIYLALPALCRHYCVPSNFPPPPPAGIMLHKNPSKNVPFIIFAIVLFIAFSHLLYHDARIAVTTHLVCSFSSLSPPPLPPPSSPPPPLPPPSSSTSPPLVSPSTASSSSLPPPPPMFSFPPSPPPPSILPPPSPLFSLPLWSSSPPPPPPPPPDVPADNSAIYGNHQEQILTPPVHDDLSTVRPSWPRPFSSFKLSSPLPSTSLSTTIQAIHADKQQVSILIPDWEVLVITSPASFNSSGDNYTCVFRNNVMTPARFSGELPSTKQITFKCEFPANVRRRLPFLQPVLIKSQSQLSKISPATAPELLRWNFLVYESFSTENDVVLFAKGVNNYRGVNRPPSEFTCVFTAAATVIRTSVTSSMQEVFRCEQPDITASQPPIPVSLEMNSEENGITTVAAVVQLPSVAYYRPPQRVIAEGDRKLICACTMVYNVAKFLKEWVLYHSKIGVEKFILYDNESNDDLQRVVDELAEEGYNVERLFWIWPKTQEAGFSHCAVNAQQTCTWMMYIDVDEFIFSPSWLNSDSPSTHMLKSLLPKHPPLPPTEVVKWTEQPPYAAAIGQVSINCHEFGPSNRSVHPIEGVTQGYTWRRRFEQRHKSIVLLEAVDHSLTNAIHHFELKRGYTTSTLGIQRAVVNHYKYQAWPEFKTKFRRRVSAYVVDWRQNLNLLSNDRTPGLGSEAVEPVGWAEKFCEVRDERLQRLTSRWFGATEMTESNRSFLLD